MNKARKRRQRRKERDLRWAADGKYRGMGRHRYKKLYGQPKLAHNKRGAFWCAETDDVPLIAKIFHRQGPVEEFMG